MVMPNTTTANVSIDALFAEASVVYAPATKKASKALAVQLDNIAGMLKDNYHLAVGWFADGVSYEDGKPVYSVAHLQEFGGKGDEGNKIPARPFMRPAMDGEQGKWREVIYVALKREFEKVKDGDIVRAFNALGAVVEGDIKEYIHKVTAPPLAPATIANRARRRGLSMEQVGNMDDSSYSNLTKPLEDTGTMIEKVTSKAWKE